METMGLINANLRQRYYFTKFCLFTLKYRFVENLKKDLVLMEINVLLLMGKMS
jgi:hypothetical protein